MIGKKPTTLARDTIRIPKEALEDFIKMRKAQKKFYDAEKGQARQGLLVQAKRTEKVVVAFGDSCHRSRRGVLDARSPDEWLEQLEKDVMALESWEASSLFNDLASEVSLSSETPVSEVGDTDLKPVRPTARLKDLANHG